VNHFFPSLRIHAFFGAAALLGLLSGCGGVTSLPAVSDPATNSHNQGQVIWRDLATPDVEKAKAFYGSVFGWTFEDQGKGKDRYTTIRHNGKAIGGMLPMADVEGQRGEWICSFSSPHVPTAVEKIQAKGGKLLGSPTQLNGRGEQAVVTDPQGAVFGLLRSSTGDPAMGGASEGDWLYTELWATDAKSARRFYSETFGYIPQMEMRSEVPYWGLFKGDTPYAGLIQNPVENTRSHWVPYIKVSDPKMMTRKAEQAGAKVLLAPTEQVRKGSVAFLLDPTGAPFVIQKYPF